MVSLIGSEGRGVDDYIYYVKDEEKGVKGVDHIGSEDDVQEILNLFQHEKLLNITTVKADEPAPGDGNRDSFFDEHYVNTQQSCTWNKGE